MCVQYACRGDHVDHVCGMCTCGVCVVPSVADHLSGVYVHVVCGYVLCIVCSVADCVYMRAYGVSMCSYVCVGMCFVVCAVADPMCVCM